MFVFLVVNVKFVIYSASIGACVNGFANEIKKFFLVFVVLMFMYVSFLSG